MNEKDIQSAIGFILTLAAVVVMGVFVYDEVNEPSKVDEPAKPAPGAKEFLSAIEGKWHRSESRYSPIDDRGYREDFVLDITLISEVEASYSILGYYENMVGANGLGTGSFTPLKRISSTEYEIILHGRPSRISVDGNILHFDGEYYRRD